MNIKKLETIAVTALEDIKAKEIEVLNTSKVTALFDRIIIATGDSNRQVKALARSVYDAVKEAGGDVIGIEGEDAGEWVLVDLGDIVVHVMQPNVRAYYNLEELWKTVPKRAAVKATPAPKAATEESRPKAMAKPKSAQKPEPKPMPKPKPRPRKKANPDAASE